MPTAIKPNKTMQFDAEKSHFSSVDDAFKWFLLGACQAKRLVLQKQLEKVERVEKLIEEAEGEVDIDTLSELDLWPEAELWSLWEHAELLYTSMRWHEEMRRGPVDETRERDLRLVHSA
jgi:hypothetical protein